MNSQYYVKVYYQMIVNVLLNIESIVVTPEDVMNSDEMFIDYVNNLDFAIENKNESEIKFHTTVLDTFIESKTTVSMIDSINKIEIEKRNLTNGFTIPLVY